MLFQHLMKDRLVMKVRLIMKDRLVMVNLLSIAVYGFIYSGTLVYS
jgi:hypothetical protein